MSNNPLNLYYDKIYVVNLEDKKSSFDEVKKT